MDEDRLPFTMKATVTCDDQPPEPLPDQLQPGWVRMPVAFQVMLPAEVMETTGHHGSAAAPAHGPGTSVSMAPLRPRLAPGALPAHTQSDASPLPSPTAPGHGSTGRFALNRGASVNLNGLGLGDTLRSRAATRPGTPFTPAPSPPERERPATGDHAPGRSTGNRALDTVMRSGSTARPSAIGTATNAGAATPEADVARDAAALSQGL